MMLEPVVEKRLWPARNRLQQAFMLMINLRFSYRWNEGIGTVKWHLFGQ